MKLLPKSAFILAAAVFALGAQAQDLTGTLKKIKDTGTITLGARESSGALAYTLGDGKYVGFHTEMSEKIAADLAKQLKRARSSIPLNISEGSHARGGRRNLHYGYAKGSAQECIAILETAVASQYIKRPPEEVIPMLRQIIGTLYNCIGGHR